MTAADVTHEATNLLQKALALPLPERSYIAERLLVSLDDESELSPAWREELDQRVKRRTTGETSDVSREEVQRRIHLLLE
jgi:putative addiction module component (TIGR02574 family)